MQGAQRPTDCAVLSVEQVCPTLSHTKALPLAWPQAAYFFPVHCTHWFCWGVGPARQTLLPVTWVQSVSAVQGRQVLVVDVPAVRSHFDAPALLQSVFARQETHDFVSGLQRSLLALYPGLVLSAQSVLERHPTQVFDVPSQTDLLASLQSDDVTHSTQDFVATLQAFLPATVEQLVFATHCTQVLSVSQMLLLAGQWALVVQPTQVLPGSLQAGAVAGQWASFAQPTQA